MDKPSKLSLDRLNRPTTVAAVTSGNNSSRRTEDSCRDESAKPPSPSGAPHQTSFLLKLTSFRRLFSRGSTSSSSQSSGGGDSPKSTNSSPADSPKSLATSTPPALESPTSVNESSSDGIDVGPSSLKVLPSQFTEENYTLVARIGYGSSAEVFLAYPTDEPHGEPVAVKRVALRNREAVDHVVAEIVLSTQIPKHPNLMRMVRQYRTEEHLGLVLPYYETDLLIQLRDLGHRIPWRDRRRIFAGLIDALYFMHSNRFAHLDVKLENVMLRKDGPDGGWSAVLGDFGFSRQVDEPEKRIAVWRGSQHYSCPQLLREMPYFAKKADVWAAGVCLYAIFYGRLPWDKPARRLDQVLRGKYPVPDLFVPPRAFKLLERMLVVDEDARASISEAKTCDWFIMGGGK